MNQPIVDSRCLYVAPAGTLCRKCGRQHDGVLPVVSTPDFNAGDRVLYVPNHAHGDVTHPDCERGIVSSNNGVNVFVRYYTRHGELSLTAQATRPDDLVKQS